MDPERYRRQMSLFEALCDQPEDARATALADVRAEDASLAETLERMLDADGAPDPFSDAPSPTGRCPTCGETWPGDVDFCPRHGTRLRPSASGDPLVGVTLDGRYRIDGIVGRGGMAVVYRAHQLNVGRDVAVKVLQVALQGHPAVARRFEREARIIAGLRHPNTLKLIDFGQGPGGALYIVNPLLQGRPLDAVLADDGPLTPSAALELLRQIAGALAEAHALGIVHRDLKPANIYVEQVGGEAVYRVLDFGIAKWTDGLHETDAGFTVGTPAYMSPEQITAGGIDGRSDIYSLGVVAYVCLTAELPWADITPVNAPHKHLDEAPRPFAALDIDADHIADIERLVRSMLAKDPADRPADAVALRTAVEVIASTRTSRPSAQATIQAAPARTATRRATIAVGFAAAAGAITLALVWPRPDGASSTSDEQAVAARDEGVSDPLADAAPDAAPPDAAPTSAAPPGPLPDAATPPPARPTRRAPAQPRPALADPPADAGYRPAPGLY